MFSRMPKSHRDLAPSDAWWETGSDTVVAWSSRQMAAKFLRGMVLPVEWEGKVTALGSPATDRRRARGIFTSTG